ncbi:metallophosphoesterase [Natronosporangium hydrolyticum]|uniref:Metallophosphoesterase n=1 Tax=Natronosporangium hydrolyticum TaxID=2811111 RepID=A0A895YFQ8_9ACTN|nr:metallophosphoesterase [Natronosporangium hydrolyticum]QSB13020.1 metallophosphoesterase [Natronosporangium hydrolyticum]
MTTEAAATPAKATSRRGRALRFTALVTAVVTLLFGVPWWTLTLAGTAWPPWMIALSTVGFAGAAGALPWLLLRGHGRQVDWAARTGDTMLGVVWVLFAWSLLGNLIRPVLAVAGLADPLRSRLIAGAVVVITVTLVAWGYREAMRVPRIRQVEVTLSRLGTGLDGLRVVLLSDTHYGPIDRRQWSARVTTVVNELQPDLVCHTGDIADGTVEARREQAAPLGEVRAQLAKVYVTGNHEYFGDAQSWLDHLQTLGWESLHNRHLVLRRGESELIVAGVDDATAGGSAAPGHRPDPATALAGADPALPVLLLAHQPKQLPQAVAHGVDLQLSGHTHGGQIWPFHLLVRLDQPTLQGLTRHGDRTQLYTTRGTGFWGPPLRIFAPSEITLLTLRAPAPLPDRG